MNTGIANRFDLGNYELIEINKRLRLYPELFYTVLMHELEHEEGKYRFKDFFHDMKSRTPGLFGFMRKHISAWTQILPFYYHTRFNQLVYDISSIVSWIMIALITTGVFFIMRWLF